MHIAFLYFIIFESTPSSLITPSMPCQSSTDDTAVSSVDAVEGCHKSTQKSFEDNAYEIPKLAGRWTLLELVELSINKDPRLTKVRQRDLPLEFWDLRRKVRNRRRTLRQKESRRAKLSVQSEKLSQGERTEEMRIQAVQAHLQQKALVAEALRSGLRVAVDCSLSEGVQSSREVRSLAKQLQLCVGANKKAPAPLNLHFVGLTGSAREFAVRSMNAERWPAHLEATPALDLFPRESLVLLSPDAEIPLDSLDPAKVYVIGGLVDRSPLKNFTAEFARRHGIAAARLPVQEYLAQQAQQSARDALSNVQCEQPRPVQRLHQVLGAVAPDELHPNQQGGAQQGPLAPAASPRAPANSDQPSSKATDGTPPCTRFICPCQSPRAAAACGGLSAAHNAACQPAKVAAELAARLTVGDDDSSRLRSSCSSPELTGQDSVLTGAAAPVSADREATDVACRSGNCAPCPPDTDAGVLEDASPAPSPMREDSPSNQSNTPTKCAATLRPATSEASTGAGGVRTKEGSFILNINDVVGILLAVNSGKSWQQAFRQCIPPRKQQQRLRAPPHAASSAREDGNGAQ